MERIFEVFGQRSWLWRYGSSVLFVCSAIVTTSLLQRVFAISFLVFIFGRCNGECLVRWQGSGLAGCCP